jgi:GNAT superfamily N-acetyltransferase
LKIRKIKETEQEKVKIAQMLIDFRRYLAELKNKKDEMEITEAVEEIDYYLDKEYPIYTAVQENKYLGYFILKFDDDAVWLEHFFVKKQYRGQGIGSRLFKKAEEVLDELGYVNLYNWVHPNNDRMISFLKSQGYDVLNMIEIRKSFENEELNSVFKVGDNKFRYN